MQVLDRQTAKDVLKGMLHAIFFHRLFGPIKPQTFEVLDVTMVWSISLEYRQSLTRHQPAVSDPETEQLVDEKVDTFWKGIEGGFSKRGQASEKASKHAKSLTCQKIIVTISEKKPKKNWFSIGEEEVPWEQWCVCLFYLPQRLQ